MLRTAQWTTTSMSHSAWIECTSIPLTCLVKSNLQLMRMRLPSCKRRLGMLFDMSLCFWSSGRAALTQAFHGNLWVSFAAVEISTASASSSAKTTPYQSKRGSTLKMLTSITIRCWVCLISRLTPVAIRSIRSWSRYWTHSSIRLCSRVTSRPPWTARKETGEICNIKTRIWACRKFSSDQSSHLRRPSSRTTTSFWQIKEVMAREWLLQASSRNCSRSTSNWGLS